MKIAVFIIVSVFGIANAECVADDDSGDVCLVQTDAKVQTEMAADELLQEAMQSEEAMSMEADSQWNLFLCESTAPYWVERFCRCPPPPATTTTPPNPFFKYWCSSYCQKTSGRVLDVEQIVTDISTKCQDEYDYASYPANPDRNFYCFHCYGAASADSSDDADGWCPGTAGQLHFQEWKTCFGCQDINSPVVQATLTTLGPASLEAVLGQAPPQKDVWQLKPEYCKSPRARAMYTYRPQAELCAGQDVNAACQAASNQMSDATR